MTSARIFAPIIVLNPDRQEALKVAKWLRRAGLGAITTAHTCDEAIFMLGRAQPSLILIDEHVPEHGERRLLQHIQANSGPVGPVMIRLSSRDSQPHASGSIAVDVILKPLAAHDVVLRVGTALQRPDLLSRLDQDPDSDVAREHLEAARRMQVGLLPGPAQIQACEAKCGIGIAAIYRTGEAVGGDFWGIWKTGKDRFALAVVDFAGHGLGAAVNTFRLHTLLNERGLPRSQPKRMASFLNERLYDQLERGQFATMLYLHIDTGAGAVEWCSAGALPPLFVSAASAIDLASRGLPLGVRSTANYRLDSMQLPGSGILAVFSDGLTESGPIDCEIPRCAIAAALVHPARLAATGQPTVAARLAARALQDTRDQYPSTGHSDDIVAVCIAFGAANERDELTALASNGSQNALPAFSRRQIYRVNVRNSQDQTHMTSKRHD